MTTFATGFPATSGGQGPLTTAHPTFPMRAITIHITIDAQHAEPLRRALVRDCAGQSWSICVAVLPGGARIRVSLTLPRIALREALAQINHLAPGAEVEQFVEVPESPSGAWMDLIQGSRARPVSLGRGSHSMTIGRILREEDVVLDLDAASQPALFRQLGLIASQRYGLDADAVTAVLIEREALGSTGLGQGIAVPHGRISGVPRELAFYIRPIDPIPFDAPDGHPVSDLVCLLLPGWDNHAHLHLLASVAQFFCDQHFRQLLRNCSDPRSVCRLFSSYPA